MDDATEDETTDSMKPIERQVERGNLFAHTALGETFNRLGEMQVFLHSVTDLLFAKGLITELELSETMDKVRQELTERGELSGPGTAVRIDPSETPSEVKVDCNARMHICKAVCCKLDLALSISEIEEGTVKWDLGRPYFIRHEKDGYCSHRDTQRSCTIHEKRPAVCRGYSCVGDERIWKNFDAMELNVEWIEANVSECRQDGPRLILMDAREVHAAPPKDSADSEDLDSSYQKDH